MLAFQSCAVVQPRSLCFESYSCGTLATLIVMVTVVIQAFVRKRINTVQTALLSVAHASAVAQYVAQRLCDSVCMLTLIHVMQCKPFDEQVVREVS
jgi:hypothetical protein